MSLYWLLGFPGWRIAANLGIPIRIKVDVYNDTEANVYYAVNKDIGLAVESESLDGLVKEIHAAMAFGTGQEAFLVGRRAGRALLPARCPDGLKAGDRPESREPKRRHGRAGGAARQKTRGRRAAAAGGAGGTRRRRGAPDEAL